MDGTFRLALEGARERAQAIANSGQRYAQFVHSVREAYPWRFEKLAPEVLERDYLRLVDHHLNHLIPRVGRYLGSDVHRVVDFGCGSGASAIALALVYPNVLCTGTDIDPKEVTIARERANLYGVADRCEFYHASAGEPLPFPAGSFDFCQCSSVLEYVVDREARRFCVHEMARLLRPGGLLFCSVPNRLYPFEIHTGKWGWNYFPSFCARKCWTARHSGSEATGSSIDVEVASNTVGRAVAALVELLSAARSRQSVVLLMAGCLGK